LLFLYFAPYQNVATEKKDYDTGREVAMIAVLPDATTAKQA
jgi:hypothetical protein